MPGLLGTDELDMSQIPSAQGNEVGAGSDMVLASNGDDNRITTDDSSHVRWDPACLCC